MSRQRRDRKAKREAVAVDIVNVVLQTIREHFNYGIDAPGTGSPSHDAFRAAAIAAVRKALPANLEPNRPPPPRR